MRIDGYQFEPQDLLKQAAAFKWYRARSPDGSGVVIQILNPDAVGEAALREALARYFEELSAVARREILVPLGIHKTADHPLMLVQRDVAGGTLSERLATCTPGEARDYWIAAAEALHALHVKGLVHGLALPASFIVGDRLYLGNFGYVPLIEAAHTQTLTELRAHGALLPPEIGARKPLTPAADIYTFAKAIGAWKTDFQKTDWYKKATATNPLERLKSIRILGEELKATFDKVVASPPCIVQTRFEPPDGGAVKGGGTSPAGTPYTLTAEPATGWRFDHWTGDAAGSTNPLSITPDRNLAITACFTRLAVAGGTGGIREVLMLILRVEPPGAGEISASNGSLGSNKRFESDEVVQLQAKPAGTWKFVRWDGDFQGSQSSVQLVMDADKTVVAHFEKVKSATVRVKAVPSTAGEVLGTGTYPHGHTLTLIAKPGSAWKFDRWDGLAPAQRRANPVRITVRGDLNLVARFHRPPPPTPRLGLLMLLLWGTPWVMLPLMTAVTAMMIVWALAITAPIVSFGAVVCFAFALGVLLTRLIFRQELLL